MKNFLLVFAIVSVFAACQSKPESSLEIKKDLPPVDNAALYNNSMLTDVGTFTEAPAPAVKKITAIRKASNKKKSAIPQARQEVYQPPVVAPESDNNTVVNNTPAPVTGNANTGTESSDATVNEPIPAPKKKGWSDAAKGATIGAVGGAIAGAVINGKSRGKGAIIGGVIGAAGGYILGRKKDKQSGRVDYSMK